MMPRSLIDAASSSSSASGKLRRGLRGLGLRYSIGTRRWVRARSGVVVASALTSPISAARPRPSRDRPSSAIVMSPDLPASRCAVLLIRFDRGVRTRRVRYQFLRSEEHTSELQSRQYLVCRLLLENKKD